MAKYEDKICQKLAETTEDVSLKQLGIQMLLFRCHKFACK